MSPTPVSALLPAAKVTNERKAAPLRNLSDAELLAACRHPRSGDHLTADASGTLTDGNHRARELLKRAVTGDGTITEDTTVPVMRDRGGRI